MVRESKGSDEADWVSAFADEVVAGSARRARGKPVVVASGVSPSGPIHLGNLREVLTPHFVADEIRRRGVECAHILSWDDFDRLRRVPAGVDPSWRDHIGKPVSSVPAPPGSPHANWAEHFKAPMSRAMDAMGVETREISQTEMYRSGTYRDQILLAMKERRRIDSILAKYRTKGTGSPEEDDGGSTGAYFPYRPYCSVCDRDLTRVTSYDDETTEMSYSCACGHSETVKLSEFSNGKLVWKVDWPMRWAYEGVMFEPSGVDHQSPGSSYVVGGEIVRKVFGGEQPIGPMYAFVGISGMAKMSSSKGAVPTPADALEIMEPPVLRWLYARRQPRKSFTVAFGQEILRTYDEWDSLGKRVQDGTASKAQATLRERAAATAKGPLPTTRRPLPYRMLASVSDITTGNEEQTLRILKDLDPSEPLRSLDEVRPRLDCAKRWVEAGMPDDQRTRVLDQPDTDLLSSLGEQERDGLRMLVDDLDHDWSLAGLTTLVYSIPKRIAGLAADAEPSPEIKALQRSFFILLYRLLVGRDTGPRLPTLLLAVGQETARHLLGG